MTITLAVVAGPHAGAEFAFSEHATFLVGRGAEAQLQLTGDPYFSRNHFVLEIDPPRCHLRDLGSRNGTNVNGLPVREAFLRDGDIISGGQTRIRAIIRDESTPPTLDLMPADLMGTALAPAPPELPDMSAAGDFATPARPHTGLLGYEILDILRHRPTSILYRARRRATGEAIALKVLLPDAQAGPRDKQLFLREASILSRLEHPRIVRFHEMGMTRDQCLFFAMEYVDRIDVDAWLGTLPTPERIAAACDLIREVLTGLIYAHEKGFVHRDIKPSNILVHREGDRLVPKLADFGLAKRIEEAGFSGITRPDQIAGTLAFLAPEQPIDGGRSAPAVDIYGAAATLYHFLTGAPPRRFPPGRDPLLVLLEDDPVPIRDRCPSLPAALAAAIHRALARRAPGDRFPIAAALLDALTPFSGGRA